MCVFLVSSGQNGNDQNYWNTKQEKKPIVPKVEPDRGFSSSGSMRELEFAADALLYWLPILLLPSEQRFNSAHSVHSAPNSRIHGMT